jgi:hypothetical protein
MLNSAACYHDYDRSMPKLDRVLSRLKPLVRRLVEELQKSTDDSRGARRRYKQEYEGLRHRYVISQIPVFFAFGLLSLYAYYVGRSASNAPTTGTPAQALLIVAGISFILWSIVVSLVSLKRVPKRMYERITDFIVSPKEALVYIVSLVVFLISFAVTWLDLVKAGMSFAPLMLLLVVALVLSSFFIIANIRTLREDRSPKDRTKPRRLMRGRR